MLLAYFFCHASNFNCRVQGGRIRRELQIVADLLREVDARRRRRKPMYRSPARLSISARGDALVALCSTPIALRRSS
jgi:hypothetical protein